MLTLTKPTRQRLLICVAALAWLPAVAVGASKTVAPPWRAAEPLGAFRVIAVEKPSLRKLGVFRDALRATCKPKTHCNVLFVDARIVKELYSLPEREQRERALLSYSTNRGFEWNCTFHPDADNCFTWD